MTEKQSKNMTVGSILALQAVILLIAWIGIRWLELEFPVESEQQFVNLLIGVLAGVITYLCLLVLVRGRSATATNLLADAQAIRESVADWGFIAIILVSLAAAIGEELLFRLLIQTWVAAKTLPWIGVVVGALAFGIAHMTSKSYFIASFLMGILLGWTFMMTGSLLLVMAWHFAYDFLSFTVLIKYPNVLFRPRGTHPGG